MGLRPRLPCRQDLLNQRLQIRFEVLLEGMLPQPAHGLADALAEKGAAAKLRNEARDLRIVEDAGVGLVAFERAGHLRRHLADEISRHLYDLGRLYSQGRRY